MIPQPSSSPVVDSVLRLQQFGPQMSDGHLLLLKGGKVLLRVWGSDAMVVPAQVVGSQAGSPAEHRMESGKDRVSLFTFHAETFWNVEVELLTVDGILFGFPGTTVCLGITGPWPKRWFSGYKQAIEQRKITLNPKKLIALTFRCPLYAL